MSGVFTIHLVKNTIAANHNKVMFVTFYFELNNIRVSYNYPNVASIVRLFGFDVTKSTRDR